MKKQTTPAQRREAILKHLEQEVWTEENFLTFLSDYELRDFYESSEELAGIIDAKAYARALNGRRAGRMRHHMLPDCLSVFDVMKPALVALERSMRPGLELPSVPLDLSVPHGPKQYVRLFDLIDEVAIPVFEQARRRGIRLALWQEPKTNYIFRPYPARRDSCPEHLKVEVPYWLTAAKLVFGTFFEAAVDLMRKGDGLDLFGNIGKGRLLCRAQIYAKDKRFSQPQLLKILNAKAALQAVGGDVEARWFSNGFDVTGWVPLPDIHEERSIAGLTRLIRATEQLQNAGSGPWELVRKSNGRMPLCVARSVSAHSDRSTFVEPSYSDERALRDIREQASKLLRSGRTLDLESLAIEAGQGYGKKIQRRLRELGLSYKDDIDVPARMTFAAELLLKGKCLKQSASFVGYRDASHFARVFRAHFGIAPSDYAGSRAVRRT